MPFLALAHKSLISGASSAGRACPGLSTPHTPVLRHGPARLVLSFLQFLPAATAVNNPVDYAVVGLAVLFCVGEQFQSLESSGSCPRTEAKTLRSQVDDVKPLFFDIATQTLGGLAPKNSAIFRHGTGEVEMSNGRRKTVAMGICRGSP